MSADEQLRWEARNGPKFAVLAFLTGVLTIAAFAANAATLQGKTGDREILRQIDSHHAGFLASRLLQALVVIALVSALYYLYRAAVARRPEGGLTLFWPIGLLAAVLLSVAAVTGYFDATSAAKDFVDGPQTAARADDLAGELSSTATKAIGSAGGLCLGLTYLLLSLNAMRAGLLSRFMGILGIIAGLLVVVPILPGAFIQLFWIVALGLLFLGRWPNGRGPAWDVVEPVPWPTAADVAAARQANAQPEEEPEALPEGDEQPGQEPRRRPASRKKKRRGGH